MFETSNLLLDRTEAASHCTHACCQAGGLKAEELLAYKISPSVPLKCSFEGHREREWSLQAAAKAVGVPGGGCRCCLGRQESAEHWCTC